MSAVRFSVLGVPVEIRASFLLLAVVLGLPRHAGPLMLAWIAIALVAVLVHEAGTPSRSGRSASLPGSSSTAVAE